MAAKRHPKGPVGPGPDDEPAADLDETLVIASPPESSGGEDGGEDGGDVEAAVVAAFEIELAEALRRAAEAEAEAKANFDRYLRAEADMDNLRKRAERLREDGQARLRRELLGRFLDVGDNLERALSHADADPVQVLDGVQATYRELMRVFTREGVAAIDALDAPFDPSLHEAVGAVPVPGLTEEIVVAVEQPGYTLNGELLRPARVVVGQPA